MKGRKLSFFLGGFMLVVTWQIFHYQSLSIVRDSTKNNQTSGDSSKPQMGTVKRSNFTHDNYTKFIAPLRPINQQLQNLEDLLKQPVTMTTEASSPSANNLESDIIIITNGSDGFWQVTEGDMGVQRCRQINSNFKCKFLFSHHEIRPESHAVLFKPFNMRRGYQVPSFHPPDQKWIFHETESPHRTWNEYRMGYPDTFWTSFNMSIVYTNDADIVHSRFAFKCDPDPEYAPSPGRNFAKENKNGTALWMVGNCKGTSGREIYVDEMKKYIDIDIYGTCGKGLVCGAFGELHVDCVKEFIGHYKFYLAFENSFCENYYTEKLTKMIGVNTIPVLMGLVNYTEVMPKGSYIDVRDFSSPKELAEYLQYLNKNDTAYNEYIETWRSVKCEELFPNRYMCRLCDYLHLNKNRIQTIPDARKFFGKAERCQTPGEFFHGIADTVAANLTIHT